MNQSMLYYESSSTYRWLSKINEVDYLFNTHVSKCTGVPAEISTYVYDPYTDIQHNLSNNNS